MRLPRFRWYSWNEDQCAPPLKAPGIVTRGSLWFACWINSKAVALSCHQSLISSIWSSLFSYRSSLVLLLLPIPSGQKSLFVIRSRSIPQRFVTLQHFLFITNLELKWFLANTKPEWRTKTFDTTALFYTAGLSARAKQIARHVNKVTIWVRHIFLFNHTIWL